jgi:integral membrane protein
MTTSIAANEDLVLIRRLRLASFVEAGTLLILLLIAVPLKHALGYSGATRIMGPVHGAAFIAYAWCVTVTVSSGGDWSRRELMRLILAAFIPFGGFANAALLRRKEAAAAQAGQN